MNAERLESVTRSERSTRHTAKLVRVSDFRKNYFEGTAPSVDSIKKMIKLGEIKGKKLLGVYYVIVDDNFFLGEDETIDNFYEKNAENNIVPIPEKVSKTGSKADEIFAKYACAV
ncbi:hypothetical protein ACMXYX_04945 [Neptuniibacter sp. QD72_48]|uniref:hypothetical protein n=1 Tax=Neptuniibacter sp. QD72_48 TaxID=3398214 RepID=UPI0039F60B5C